MWAPAIHSRIPHCANGRHLRPNLSGCQSGWGDLVKIPFLIASRTNNSRLAKRGAEPQLLAKLSCPALFLKIVQSSFSTSFASSFFYLKITLCKGVLQTTSKKSRAVKPRLNQAFNQILFPMFMIYKLFVHVSYSKSF